METLNIDCLVSYGDDFVARLDRRLAHWRDQGWPVPARTLCLRPAAETCGESELLLGEPAHILHYLQKYPEALHRLRWIQSSFAGVDALAGLALPSSCKLTAMKAAFGPLISEYVFGHLLSYRRDFLVYRQQQADKLWRQHSYRSIAGETLLVVGLGGIGRHLLTTARHFGMRTLGVCRTGVSDVDADAIYPVSALQRALAQADVVVLALPATADSRKLMDAAALSALKPGALLFNVGRGVLVDDPALLQALDAGIVAHAWLDVFQQEPLPADHPFWSHAGVTVTPHVAALTFEQDLADFYGDNLARWLCGKPLLGEVDLARGY
ncbi:D-2-hydroxyacid dehydrogenase [Simiduia agarivorans]|uniref:D-isomer specific 2-hydroxyacid dehydrogenase family protein n=1 Tax=Simiduia agarivorans (strain DSM 21679 / JCM 13881 / BCRC 17597 / SA1) TaxID=1117647 RepID=K4KPA8_SIMAS|nr:D-2-hydroxyacid dehydrogenase [Simiduia agarivorans]AFV00862.1 D-isomer specific 2-hydroxyacid dehydrogenase family protein [Simiduia agarivorans SA1 = DSM 21679]